MKALELENIYLRQGNFLINNLSFSVEEGQTLVLVGKSGCGKSTLIRLIGNGTVADSGIIRYFGKELYEDEKNIRKSMSVIYDRINFNREMRCLRLAKEIKKFEADFDMEGFEKYLDLFEVDKNMRIRYLSTGMRKKYMLSIALCRNPRLLVMDELTSGVDEKSRQLIWQVIKEYRRDRPLTVIFSTHHMDDIENSGGRVIEMEGGAIL